MLSISKQFDLDQSDPDLETPCFAIRDQGPGCDPKVIIDYTKQNVGFPNPDHFNQEKTW